MVHFIDLLKILGIIIGIGLFLSLCLLAWVVVKVRRINLPAGSDFFDALRATPLSVVVLLDLLDLSLDIFSAPLAWILLGKLGLEPLRPVTMIKDLIPLPGLEALPTMTIAWGVSRVWKNAHLPTISPEIIDVPSARRTGARR
jgi:hypothetical protein